MIVPPGSINTDDVHTVAGDFNKKELAIVADTPTIVGNAVREYKKYAMGKRAIARGVNIRHSQDIAAQLNSAGVPALHVDGETQKAERYEAMSLFKAGKILVLSNVDLFSEGLNVPAAECILDLRPTQSLTLCLQFWYRAMRPAPGKEHAILLDFAGNLRRHGLPCQEREWSLEGRKKSKAGVGAGALICPKCFGAQFGRPPKCEFCGYEFEAGEGREIKQVDGELEEVDIEKERARIQAKREQGAARTMEDLIALGAKRGYKNPRGWAYNMMKARGAKK